MLNVFLQVMRLGALLLTLVLLVLQFRMTMVQVDYILNKDYISAELCIEKDVENSTCEGKCHLKKEMAKVQVRDERDDQRVPIRIQIEEINFIDCQCEDAAYLFSDHLVESNFSNGHMRTARGHYIIFSPPPELG